MSGVQYDVKFVPQQLEMTCWAASMAMLVNQRDGTHLRDHDVVQKARRGEEGASEIDVGIAASEFGMQRVYAQSSDATGWQALLEANGPLYVTVHNDPHHAVVVSGADPAIGDQGSLYVLDPLRGEGWVELEHFARNYELAANWLNGVYSA